MISCFKGRFRVTSPRGWRTLNGGKDYHGGLDLVGLDSTVVYSVCDGVVRTAYQANGAGNYVVVTMPDGRRVFTMHLASFKVKNGAVVKAGDAIGVMGNTGYSFGAHTHLELRPAGTTGKSLDICAFTGIPNACGVYEYEEEKNMANRFKDITGSMAEKEIEELCDMGIIEGDGNGRFRPRDALSREEAALLLRRVVRFVTGK